MVGHQKGCGMDNTPPQTKPDRKRGSGVKHVYDMLRDEIIDLALEPGSPIDEIQLADRFEMSRTPIREALVRLAAEGLVTTLPNRSTVVANINFLTLHTFFDALSLMYRVTTRLAAENRTAKDLETIRARQAAFAEAVQAQDALTMIATNRDFHVAIAIAGQNTYYEGLFIRLLDEGRRILRLYYQSFHDQLPQKFVIEHENIIAAIAERDIEKADSLALEHANQIITQIKQLIAIDRRQKIAL
jgi:DNA-binding GntR family transcriptional regulator